ncbi:hypothetical protein AB9P05_12735 [Roseivirga sp. BDSF3-8]|uniref:hypothetical protein n=1 Tax=Roseivirga sp. BDSF3-8 TaxID=3241598 RepID=UPI003531A6B4
MMKLFKSIFISFVLFFICQYSYGQPDCWIDRLIKNTDETTEKGLELSIAIKHDEGLLDAHEVLYETGLPNLSGDLPSLEKVSDYIKNNPEIPLAQIADDITVKGWGKWIYDINATYIRYSTRIDNYIVLLERENLFGDQALTFLDAQYRTVQSNRSITLYRTFGGDAKVGGSFVTTTKNATRNELALLEEWNNSMRFEAKIEVPSGTKMNIGKVGPQESEKTGLILKGGEDQIILPFQWDTNWVIEIIDKETGKVYNSVEEFSEEFKDLAK